ncbi:MAG: hypothetical protein ACK559_34900, partial [bacterium]
RGSGSTAKFLAAQLRITPMDTEKEAEKGLLMSENMYCTVQYTRKIYKMYKCGFSCDASLSKIQKP